MIQMTFKRNLARNAGQSNARRDSREYVRLVAPPAVATACGHSVEPAAHRWSNSIQKKKLWITMLLRMCRWRWILVVVLVVFAECHKWASQVNRQWPLSVSPASRVTLLALGQYGCVCSVREKIPLEVLSRFEQRKRNFYQKTFRPIALPEL